jgi:hypothetical protein
VVARGPAASALPGPRTASVAWTATSAASSAASATAALALRFAFFAARTAPLGLVREAAFGVAFLIFGGMDELLTAVAANDGLVLEGHVSGSPIE